MHRWAGFRFSHGQGLIALFVSTLVLPGALLTFFGYRILQQEKRLASQQVRERLEHAADAAARELEGELRRWQQVVEQAQVPRSASDANRWLRTTVVASGAPGAAVLVVRRNGDDLQAFPADQLLYRLAPVIRSEPPPAGPAGLAEAERAELRDKNYGLAIRLYRQLLAGAPAHRALLVYRLARTHQKAGLQSLAIELFRKLEALRPAAVGQIPASILARYELCSIWNEQGQRDKLAPEALGLYSELLRSGGTLEKSLYLFYSESVRNWLDDAAPARAEFARLKAAEQKKLALTVAAEQMLRDPRRVLASEAGTHLGFWTPDPFAAVVLSKDFLQKELWPRTFSARALEDLEVSLFTPAGQLLFGPPPSRAGLSVTRVLDEAGLRWRLQVRPRQPDVFDAGAGRRQKLYLAMFALVAAVLGFGGYLTARTVTREIEVARLKSDFVSTVSHEFRSPLTGIRQLAEILMRVEPPRERRAQYYERIERESARLTRLVENVLDFARMEEGRKQYRLEPLETEAWLRELARDFRAQAEEQGFSLIASIPEQLPALLADGEALACAVHNLFDNAIKYSPGGKTVWLEAEARNGRITIRVRDQGLGIAHKDLSHIFEKFYRGSGEPGRPVRGAGLGLSLVKHIVTAHGGSVACQSRPGEGSTFSLDLPALPCPTAAGMAPAGLAEQGVKEDDAHSRSGR